jgi:CRP-like cAMP-binding protein
MAIKESDLFKGTSQRFITKIATNSEELTFRKNALLFSAAETAQHFYVLVEGSVEMTVGKREGIRFTVNRAGEVFGWSALVAPNVYTATARATKDTKVIKISRDLVENAIGEHPPEGLALLKNLTSIIANRLRYAYQAFPAET